MLKEAISYLVSLGDNKTYEINGQTYSDNALFRVAPYVPRPEEHMVNSLDSIVQIVKNELDKQPKEMLPIFIQVETPRRVSVYSSFDADMRRNRLYRADCDAPQFTEGFREYDKAIIELRSKFVPNEDTEYLLDLLSRINKDDGVQTEDNGVSQTVTARTGISLKEKVGVRPRVKLRPFRTFTEVEQPESEFLTRLDNDGNVGFFEADGGAWKLEAKRSIAEYLKASLTNQIEVGSVVVMS